MDRASEKARGIPGSFARAASADGPVEGGVCAISGVGHDEIVDGDWRIERGGSGCRRRWRQVCELWSLLEILRSAFGKWARALPPP